MMADRTETTPNAEKIAAEGPDLEKRCFTYCGPERCNCCAADAFGALRYIEPALPVLSTMCRKAGLSMGAAKADEMHGAVREILRREA